MTRIAWRRWWALLVTKINKKRSGERCGQRLWLGGRKHTAHVIGFCILGVRRWAEGAEGRREERGGRNRRVRGKRYIRGKGEGEREKEGEGREVMFLLLSQLWTLQRRKAKSDPWMWDKYSSIKKLQILTFIHLFNWLLRLPVNQPLDNWAFQKTKERVQGQKSSYKKNYIKKASIKKGRSFA